MLNSGLGDRDLHTKLAILKIIWYQQYLTGKKGKQISKWKCKRKRHMLVAFLKDEITDDLRKDWLNAKGFDHEQLTQAKKDYANKEIGEEYVCFGTGDTDPWCRYCEYRKVC